jgi:hypothetical protein
MMPQCNRTLKYNKYYLEVFSLTLQPSIQWKEDQSEHGSEDSNLEPAGNRILLTKLVITN